MLKHEYKKGDKVELNCTEKQFCENVQWGGDVLKCFIDGVAVVSHSGSSCFGGVRLAYSSLQGCCTTLHASELKYIKPKRKTVVDAVNYLKGIKIPTDKFVVCEYNNGKSFGFSAVIGDIDDIKDICTVNEYKGCIKEMEEAAWMNDNEPQSYAAHKQWWADVQKDAVECDHEFEYSKKPKSMESFVDEMFDKFGRDNVIKAITSADKAFREREEMAKALYANHKEAAADYFKGMAFGEWDKMEQSAKDIYLTMIDKGVTIK